MAHLRSNKVLPAARGAAMAFAIVLSSSASIGWLYWLRARTLGWPGPRLGDALPLDELPTHADVPLILFVASFGLAGVLLGFLARTLHIDGLSGAIATGTGVAIWLYLVSAVSIFVVRQVPLDFALDDARDLEAVYVGAALCAVAVGLVAPRPARRQLVARLGVVAVAILGLTDFFVGMVPGTLAHRGVFAILAVGGFSSTSRAVAVTVGGLLLLTVAGLGRRSRRAASAALVLALASLLLPLVGGFSVTVTVLAAIVLLLISAGRQDFAYPGDPAKTSAALIRVVATAAATAVYGLLALFVNRTAADLPFQLGAAVTFTLRELVGISPSHPSLLSGGFGEWFPWSLRGIAGSGLLSAAVIWLAPWRQRLSEDRYGRLRARGIVHDWGVDTLAPFTLRADKAHFFFPDDDEAGVADQVLIAYRALRGIALVSGDPIGPAPYVGPAVRAFRAYCAAHGWKVAIVGASERYLETYEGLGLRTLYHGEEAILDTRTFSLGGGALKSVRQAAHRLDRKGYSAVVVAAGDLRPEERDELVAVESGWLRGKPRKGFVMELDDLFRLDGDDAVFVIGRDRSGQIVGFLQLAVCPASHSLSLSTMPRSDMAPNGLNAFLIVEIVEWARQHEFGAVSLNFSPFARLLDPGASLDGPQRLARGALLVVKRVLNLQLDNLLAFNRHFAPRWQRRFVVYERRRNLARIALVAMAAERYLPFTDLLRGRRWESAERAGERARTEPGSRARARSIR